jgi:hypothetical protein
MQVKLPILFLLMALASGCMSGTSDGRPPNYVESQLTQSPIPPGSMGEDPDLPGDVGGPE